MNSIAQYATSAFLKKHSQKNENEFTKDILVTGLAQGTIEYLIILAIIIVLALLVVSFVGGFADTGSGISKTQSEAYWKSQEIGVTDAIVDSNGDAVLVVNSTSAEQLTIKKFFINDTEVDVPDTKIFNGTKSFFVENLPACTTETCSYDLKIEYTNKHGTNKIIKGTTKLVTKQTTDATENNVTDTDAIIVKMTGTGTSIDPYLIKTCEQLQTMNDSKSSTYHLANNIDCSDTINWNNGAGFEPVGNSTNTFSGTFDGQNHTINNLYIYRPDENYIGLFGRNHEWSAKDINNLGMIDSNITGYVYVGGIIGRGGKINNCYNTGTITGTGYTASGYDSGIGGLSGIYGVVNDSYNTGTINGIKSVGGIGGYSRTITNSYNTGTINGASWVAGISGYRGTITNSYNTGTINGTTYTGGLIGRFGTVKYSYNTGTVTGSNATGGISGTGSVYHSYNTGDVNGWNYTGGITGNSGGKTILNCYNSGTIIGRSTYTGGIVGLHGSITNSYNNGFVKGTSYLGGITGKLYSGETIKNSFSTSTITGNGNGTIGNDAGGTLTNIYWYDSNSLDNATTCYPSGNTNCTILTDVNYTQLFNSTTDIYDSTEPTWDGNWVWSGTEYPKLSWE